MRNEEGGMRNEERGMRNEEGGMKELIVLHLYGMVITDWETGDLET